MNVVDHLGPTAISAPSTAEKPQMQTHQSRADEVDGNAHGRRMLGHPTAPVQYAVPVQRHRGPIGQERLKAQPGRSARRCLLGMSGPYPVGATSRATRKRPMQRPRRLHRRAHHHRDPPRRVQPHREVERQRARPATLRNAATRSSRRIASGKQARRDAAFSAARVAFQNQRLSCPTKCGLLRLGQLAMFLRD